jgi:hypothetical protein
METSKPGNELTATGAVVKNGRGERRRRWEVTSADMRYFLPKAGSSSERPELGREMTSEAAALLEAFKHDQPFYTLVVWKAVSDTDDGTPRIVKETMKRS